MMLHRDCSLLPNTTRMEIYTGGGVMAHQYTLLCAPMKIGVKYMVISDLIRNIDQIIRIVSYYIIVVVVLRIEVSYTFRGNNQMGGGGGKILVFPGSCTVCMAEREQAKPAAPVSPRCMLHSLKRGTTGSEAAAKRTRTRRVLNTAFVRAVWCM